jgi:excisionase family DNA binding protein
MKETMTAPEAARALQVGLNYLYALLLSGKLPGERVNGRWQIEAADIRARIAETEKYKRRD